jgi:hypothetical protein
MNIIANFDETGTITYTEEKPKGPDLTALQMGMFTDRPDLWRISRKAHRRAIPPLPGQAALIPPHNPRGLEEPPL